MTASAHRTSMDHLMDVGRVRFTLLLDTVVLTNRSWRVLEVRCCGLVLDRKVMLGFLLNPVPRKK